MKLEITESKKNDLLNRTEITGTITFEEATPRRSEVKKAIAAAAKCKEDLLVVKKIDSRYGGKSATVTAVSYSDKDLFEKVEREYMRTRNTKVAKPKEEAPDATPAAEEAKPEEAKEDTPEKPAEAKPEEKKDEAKEDTPKEAAKEDAKSEEAPKEEVKPEETKEAAPDKKEDAEVVPEAEEKPEKKEGD